LSALRLTRLSQMSSRLMVSTLWPLSA